MKSITLKTTIIATCIAFSHLAWAQSPTPTPTPPENAGHHWKHGHGARLEHLAKALGLNAAQTAQLKEVFQAHKAELKAIRENQSLTREQKFAQIKNVMAEIKTQASSFLTPAQIQQWDAMKQGRKGHRHGHKGPQATPTPQPTP